MEIKPLKVLRSAIIFAAFVYLSYYSYSSLSDVLEAKVGITVGTEPLTTNFSLPYITVCPRFTDSQAVGIKKTVYQDKSVTDSITSSYGEMDISPFELDASNIVKFFRFHNKGLVKDALMFEPCYTFKQTVDKGREKMIDLNMKNVIDVFMIFHPNIGLASTLFNIYGNDRPHFQSSFSHLHGTQLSKNLEIELQIVKRRIRHQTSQCVMNDQDLDLLCVEKYVQERIGCTLPWVIEGNENHRRLCNSQEDFQKMANYLNDTDELSPSQMKSLLRNMGCKIPCDYDQYIHRIVLDDNHFQDSDTFLSASVFLKNQDIRIETEVILNDFWSFLAGVGGYMGLLLGFSMLTLYDFVAGMIEEFIAG